MRLTIRQTSINMAFNCPEPPPPYSAVPPLVAPNAGFDTNDEFIARMRRFLAFRLATDYNLKDACKLSKEDWFHLVALSRHCYKIFSEDDRFYSRPLYPWPNWHALPTDSRLKREIVEPCRVLDVDPHRGIQETRSFIWSICLRRPRTVYLPLARNLGYNDSDLWRRLVYDRNVLISRVISPSNVELADRLVHANLHFTIQYFGSLSSRDVEEATTRGKKARVMYGYLLMARGATPEKTHMKAVGEMAKRLAMDEYDASRPLSPCQRLKRWWFGGRKEMELYVVQ